MATLSAVQFIMYLIKLLLQILMAHLMPMQLCKHYLLHMNEKDIGLYKYEYEYIGIDIHVKWH